MIIDPDEFTHRYIDCSDDERAVLCEMLRRIEIGREQYGELNLDRDRRDFRKEARDEAIDWLVYDCADSLKREREGR